MKRKVFRIISSGGLGDVLLSTPTFEALKEKYRGCKIIVVCRKKRDRDVYRNNPYIDALRDPSAFRYPVSYLFYRLKWTKYSMFYYGNVSPGLFYKKNAAEIIGEMFGVTISDSKIKIYLTKKEESKAISQLDGYKNPIILHTTAACSKNKNWTLEKWEKLVRDMPEYTFIQLGLSKEEKVEGAVDMRGRTSFRESMALIRSARGFVGVDSSLAHVTAAFDIPGVVLFGPTTPLIWGHPNNINLYKGFSCSPCIDLLSGSPCPYGKPCMTNISTEEVRQALLSQLAACADQGNHRSDLRKPAYV